VKYRKKESNADQLVEGPPDLGSGYSRAWALTAMELAAHESTPCYFYDEAAAEAQAERLIHLLGIPGSADDALFYSFKSNPNPALAAAMRRRGCRPELTSPGEVEAARIAGFELSDALYGGPGKGIEEWREALVAGVRCFSVESKHDLESLVAACREAGTTAQALLRVNPEQAPRARVAMSGVASQFGFEEAELLRSAHELMEAGPEVDLIGFHIYWGTQIGGAEALLESFSRALETMERLAEETGIRPRVLNLGGGFPWPYAQIGLGEDLSSLQEELAALRTKARASRWIGEAAWWFESGRYLSAPAGTLVARVMDIKQSKEERLFLILDTGIHHLGGMAGLGRIPRFRVDLVTPREREGLETVEIDVVGPLCTPLDCIGRRIEIPKSLRRGDLVAIPNVGAYGVTASVSPFLSRRPPLEILIREGAVVARHRLRSGHEAMSAHSAAVEAGVPPRSSDAY